MTRKQILAICKHLASTYKTTVRITTDGFEGYDPSRGIWRRFKKEAYEHLIAGGAK